MPETMNKGPELVWRWSLRVRTAAEPGAWYCCLRSVARFELETIKLKLYML